jgi:hypothetical protein
LSKSEVESEALYVISTIIKLIVDLLLAVGHTAPTAATTLAAAATVTEDGFIFTATITSTLYIKQRSRQGSGKHNFQEQTRNCCSSNNDHYNGKES